MKAMMESTDQTVELIGCHQGTARVWNGVTEAGVTFQALILRVAVPIPEQQVEFERELLQARAPVPAPAAFPLRMFL